MTLPTRNPTSLAVSVSRRSRNAGSRLGYPDAARTAAASDAVASATCATAKNAVAFRNDSCFNAVTQLSNVNASTTRLRVCVSASRAFTLNPPETLDEKKAASIRLANETDAAPSVARVADRCSRTGVLVVRNASVKPETVIRDDDSIETPIVSIADHVAATATAKRTSAAAAGDATRRASRSASVFFKTESFSVLGSDKTAIAPAAATVTHACVAAIHSTQNATPKMCVASASVSMKPFAAKSRAAEAAYRQTASAETRRPDEPISPAISERVADERVADFALGASDAASPVLTQVICRSLIRPCAKPASQYAK